MKYIVISLLFGLSWFSGAAQDLKVRVVTPDNRPLDFVHILVNGVGVGLTDSLGVVSIPEKGITPGDTIIASYVGMRSGYAIYNRNPELQIILSPVVIDAATVTAKKIDPHKLFKQYVNQPSWEYLQRVERSTNLVADVHCRFDNDTLFYTSFKEIFFKMFLIPVHPNLYAYFQLPKNMSALAKDKDFIADIRRLMGRMTQNFYVYWAYYSRYPVSVETDLSYNGIEDNCHVFVQTQYFGYYAPGHFTRVVYYADRQSREIVKIEVSIFGLRPGEHVFSSKWQVDYQIIDGLSIPSRIEYVSFMDGKPMASYLFDNITTVKNIGEIEKEFRKDKNTIRTIPGKGRLRGLYHTYA